MKEIDDINSIVCPYCKTINSLDDKTCSKCKNRIPESIRTQIKPVEKEIRIEKTEKPKKENSIDKILANSTKNNKPNIITEESKEYFENKKTELKKQEESIEDEIILNKDKKTEEVILQPEKNIIEDSKDKDIVIDLEPKEEIELDELEDEKTTFDIEDVRPELDLDNPIDENDNDEDSRDDSGQKLKEVVETQEEVDKKPEDDYEFEYIDQSEYDEETEEDWFEDEDTTTQDIETLDESNEEDKEYIDYDELDKTVVIQNLEADIKKEKIIDANTLNLPKYFVRSLLNPYDKYKKEEEKLENVKTVSIITIIVVITMTILSLLSTMINNVRVTSFWTGETSWVWKNLQNISYFKEIGQNILIYTSIIIGISLVYFILNILLKKRNRFSKFIAAVVTSFIPFGIAFGLLTPILNLIYIPLGLAISVIGFIYSLLVFLEIIDYLLNIEDHSRKIFIHLICLSIIFITIVLIAYQMISPLL